MTTSHRILGALAATGAAALVLSGCVAKSDVDASAAFDVSSTAGDCAAMVGRPARISASTGPARPCTSAPSTSREGE